MENIEEYIRSADKARIDRVLEAILERNREMYPNDELVILSLPKADLEERHRIIDLTARLLKEEYSAGA